MMRLVLSGTAKVKRMIADRIFQLNVEDTPHALLPRTSESYSNSTPPLSATVDSDDCHPTGLFTTSRSLPIIIIILPQLPHLPSALGSGWGALDQSVRSTPGAPCQCACHADRMSTVALLVLVQQTAELDSGIPK
jgi:hypothetical protein